MHASEQTSGRLVVNALPGLKSVASATAAPAPTRARALGIGRSRKRALAGSSTPTTSLSASVANAGGAGRLEVIDGARSELDGKGDRTALRELVAVQAQRQAGSTARPEIAASLGRVERAALEKDVGRRRQLRGRR